VTRDLAGAGQGRTSTPGRRRPRRSTPPWRPTPCSGVPEHRSQLAVPTPGALADHMPMTPSCLLTGSRFCPAGCPTPAVGGQVLVDTGLPVHVVLAPKAAAVAAGPGRSRPRGEPVYPQDKAAVRMPRLPVGRIWSNTRGPGHGLPGDEVPPSVRYVRGQVKACCGDGHARSFRPGVIARDKPGNSHLSRFACGARARKQESCMIPPGPGLGPPGRLSGLSRVTSCRNWCAGPAPAIPVRDVPGRHHESSLLRVHSSGRAAGTVAAKNVPQVRLPARPPHRLEPERTEPSPLRSVPARRAGQQHQRATRGRPTVTIPADCGGRQPARLRHAGRAGQSVHTRFQLSPAFRCVERLRHRFVQLVGRQPAAA